MSTTIYVRTTGSDVAGNGTINNPYRTAQVAFSAAYFGTDEYILDFGPGNFGGIKLGNIANYIRSVTPDSSVSSFILRDNGIPVAIFNFTYPDYVNITDISSLYYISVGDDQPYTPDLKYVISGPITYETNLTPPPLPVPWRIGYNMGGDVISYIPVTVNWPSRIKLRGISQNTTFLGGISAFVENGVIDPSYNFLITPPTNGATINLSAVSINIGDIYNIGGNGGATNLLYAGTGGTLILSGNDINFNDINVSGGGGASAGASGGTVNIANCTVNNILGIGGEGDTGGLGSSITVDNSIVNRIEASGGNTSASAMGGNGGTVNVINTKVSSININGGNTAYTYPGGIGGTANIINSTVTEGISALNSPYSTNDITAGSIKFIGKNTIPKYVFGNTDFSQIIVSERENAIAISQLLRLPFPINI